MTNVDFIYDLEYRLGYGEFWCDGIFLQDENPDELTKIINDKRFLTIPIHYGKSGQESYTLNLYFGKKALSRNARGLDLLECLPDFANEPDYISVDEEKKVLNIQLK